MPQVCGPGEPVLAFAASPSLLHTGAKDFKTADLPGFRGFFCGDRHVARGIEFVPRDRGATKGPIARAPIS